MVSAISWEPERRTEYRPGCSEDSPEGGPPRHTVEGLYFSDRTGTHRTRSADLSCVMRRGIIIWRCGVRAGVCVPTVRSMSMR